MALINCPECNKEVSDKAEVCIHCGYPLRIDSYTLKITGYQNTDSYAVAGLVEIFDKTYDEGFEIVENLPYEIMKDRDKEVVINYATRLQKKLFDVEIVDNYGKAIEFDNAASINKISCPKCGSTQIQAVSRKWSLMTGILTNQVDRVCLNCKHKF